VFPDWRKISTAGAIFGRVFGRPVHVEDLPESETTPQIARSRGLINATANAFTGYVDLIRTSKFLGPRVCDLGKLMWGLVGNRIVPGMIGLTVRGRTRSSTTSA
jgi:hypothetical protein